MSDFSVGQEVTVFSSDGKVDHISVVEKIVRKVVHVAGETSTYSVTGWQRNGSSMRLRHICQTTDAHRDELRRRDLWRTVDMKLGTFDGAHQRKEIRESIPTDTLAKLAGLLAPSAATP